MKNLLLFLLLACSGSYAQKKVYNVQWYCVDERPFNKSQCDISGNEYSFVFLDPAKKEAVFFFTSMKLEFSIRESYPDQTDPDYTYYVLKSGKSNAEMRINKAADKIEFIYPDKIIYLTVGKSTKLEKRGVNLSARK